MSNIVHVLNLPLLTRSYLFIYLFISSINMTEKDII